MIYKNVLLNKVGIVIRYNRCCGNIESAWATPPGSRLLDVPFSPLAQSVVLLITQCLIKP